MIRRLPSALRVGRLQGRLLLVIALAFVAATGADAVNLLGYYTKTLENAQLETGNLSRSLAEQAHGTFQTMDAILLGLRQRVETDSTGPVARQRLQPLLDLPAQALGFVHRLMIVDAQGHLLLASGGPPGPGDLSSDTSFAFHRTHPDRAPRLATPSRDPVDGAWTIAVSRRVDNPDGSFGGMVMASVASGYFRSVYSLYQNGGAGVILLARADAVALARWPADPRGEGHDLSGGDLFRRVIGPGDRSNFNYVSEVDHRRRLGSYTRLADFPALVMVARSRQLILSDWRKTVFAHAVGLCIVLSLIGVLGHRLALKIGEVQRAQDDMRAANLRLAASEASTARANTWLEMAAQIAQVGHWNLEVGDPPVLTWSDEVYRIHGLDRQRFTPTLDGAVSAYHPQDRALVTAAVGAAVHAGTPFEFTARIVRPDGSTRHVLSRGVPQADAAGNTTAVFGVFVDISEQQRSEAALRVAHAEAEAANQALEAANRALETMAMQDSLTGLANRRHFDRALDEEFRRAVRSGTSLGMIMIDVDHFKQFNDLYGHQAGDACLRTIAELIPPLLNRPGDTVARYGGEEIAVLLPGNTEIGTIAMAARIADAVRGHAIQHAGSPYGVVTVSAGVEAYVPVHEQDVPSEMVEHADRALYAAKRAGRDRVATYRAWLAACTPAVDSLSPPVS